MPERASRTWSKATVWTWAWAAERQLSSITLGRVGSFPEQRLVCFRFRFSILGSNWILESSRMVARNSGRIGGIGGGICIAFSGFQVSPAGFCARKPRGHLIPAKTYLSRLSMRSWSLSMRSTCRPLQPAPGVPPPLFPFWSFAPAGSGPPWVIV